MNPKKKKEDRILGFENQIVEMRNPYVALGFKSIICYNFFVGNYLVKESDNGQKEFYVILLACLN